MVDPEECKLPETSEDVTVEKDAIEAMKDLGVKDPVKVLSDCKKVVEENKVTVERNYLQNNEESILITSYTYEDKINGTSPYRIINSKLRKDKAQDQLTNKKSYLCLLLRALRKLPRTKPQTLYRSITKDEREYKVGEEIEWQGFTSTSTSMKVTQAFLTNKETNKVEGTLFEVRNEWGYNVADFSQYPKEAGRAQKAKTILSSFNFCFRSFVGANEKIHCERSYKAGLTYNCAT